MRTATYAHVSNIVRNFLMEEPLNGLFTVKAIKSYAMECLDLKLVLESHIQFLLQQLVDLGLITKVDSKGTLYKYSSYEVLGYL